jgi:hypothetical protein
MTMPALDAVSGLRHKTAAPESPLRRCGGGRGVAESSREVPESKLRVYGLPRGLRTAASAGARTVSVPFRLRARGHACSPLGGKSRRLGYCG